MADSSTHLLGATALCSFAATLVAKGLGTGPADALLMLGAGVAAGVLPDIDLERSRASRALFTALAALASLGWLFANVERYSAVELWAVAAAIALAVRWPLMAMFHRIAVHRGALHSLAAAAMWGTLATVGAHRGLGETPEIAWMVGAFTVFGYLVHLAMDEIWSVDFSGARIKRSFGTALKPIDFRRLPGSIAILATTLVAWFFTPPTATAVATARALAGGWREALLP